MQTAEGGGVAGGFEAAGVGLGLVDAAGCFVSVNGALGDIFVDASLLGKTPATLSDDECFRALQAALAAGDRRQLDVEVLRSGADRAPVRLRIRGSRLDGGGDVGAAAVYVVEDVTERFDIAEALAATRRELEARAAELERSNADLARFASVASHDLSEPLRMVTSYVQLIARRLELTDDDELATYVAFAVDGAQRMRALINDVLRYAEAGRAGAAHTEVDLNAVLRDVQQDLRSALHDTAAAVVVDELPTVRGDRGELAQVFTNLLMNALKFHQPGVPPTVNVTAQACPIGWRVSVRDEGIGIDAEHRERVFAMFQRLHSRTAYPGTGIGLALCRRIVESHGGQIWIEGATGTTVSFTLKAAA